jgi:hypothetical protein
MRGKTMADNRILIVHVPTGRSVCLSKFWYSDGWKKTQDTIQKELDEFFEFVNESCAWDSIAIAMEMSTCKHVLTDWSYKTKNEIEIENKPQEV